MFIHNTADVHKNWNAIVDMVISEKPQLIKGTNDNLMLADLKLIKIILDAYSFSATKYIENDGSITLSLNEIDLVENAPTESEAKLALGSAILKYAEDFYGEFQLWSNAPNRKEHVPYILKALIYDDAAKIGDTIVCQNGKA